MKRTFIFFYMCLFLKGYAMQHNNNDVLNYLKDNNKWSTSISLQISTRHSSNVNDNIAVTNTTFIRDNNRCQWKGTSVLKTNENEIIEEGGHVKYTIMNGDEYLLAIGSDLNTIKRASMKQTGYKETQSLILDEPDTGSALWGRIYGNNGMDIYHLLEQCPNVQYGKSNFLIEGLECYEIEGTCKYGKIKIIFSPEKGYFPLKWEITKKPGDYYDNKLLTGKHWQVVFQVEEVKNIDGFYIPLKGSMKHDVVSKDDQHTSLFYDYEISNIQVSPDFDAINAFEFDLPSNVPVTLEKAPGIRYVWQDGKPVLDVDDEFLDVLDEDIEQLRDKITLEPRRKNCISQTKTSSQKDNSTQTSDLKSKVNSDEKLGFSKKLIFILISLLAVLVIVGLIFRLNVS